jgi:hypothetical protein
MRLQFGFWCEPSQTLNQLLKPQPEAWMRARKNLVFLALISVNRSRKQSLPQLGHATPSSRGLGHWPFTPATRVRIP